MYDFEVDLTVFFGAESYIKDESLADWIDVNQLGYDAEGRLTYQNKVVRIYPVSRLKKLNAQRRVLIGEVKAEKKK